MRKIKIGILRLSATGTSYAVLKNCQAGSGNRSLFYKRPAINLVAHV